MKIAIATQSNNVWIMDLYGDALDAAMTAPEHIDAVIQAEIDAWHESMKSQVKRFFVINDEQEIPSDEFFDALRADESGAALVIDMDRAREIHKTQMRLARIPKLAALDVAFQRALETGADTSAIVAQKQALRDVTSDPAIEAAQTPEELKLVWPEILD